MKVRWADSVSRAAVLLSEYECVLVRSRPGQSVLILFCNETMRDRARAAIGGKNEGEREGYPSLASRASNLVKRLEKA